ncbi:hypothetical protein A2380_01115 [candidate division WWE3 bacterium RIFOXYB1_FULL_43_24]|uniref:Uncharacterized protein n=2 Tax=Katanobacteria TaxID=422282 RepID=A0A0G0YS47_UNCKA|nr:MAG: hypothetical protein UU92_C0001G0063 [candidate division WWE3 bacterium GW2011_GWA1_42_12]KKS35194.1 MAG: hypothetical protein UU97_C0001G0045 [candidate division WWE3 bacterium GW2011_GWD1_42_14]KKS39455.1 MAG: hypothetical protein UV00_C0001G0023 [candidate division WWE3 bacterium GW2011_GWF1_42_14]KKS40898.1 MAG: hypothetical protein UV03_C0001G0023 [candidate division WWE3 bacterium GW2011_GWE1_42_16]KKS67280.1 MAG: hypothetical protein UV35_C0001G0048 [candidate division WWE3 bacte
MSDTIIRLLKNGGFGYIRGEDLCKSDTCEYYVSRDNECFGKQSETHNIMVKRAGPILQVTDSGVEKAGCKSITREDLMTGDYISVEV